MPKISDKQREGRRQQILEAALACFAEDGFHRQAWPTSSSAQG